MDGRIWKGKPFKHWIQGDTLLVFCTLCFSEIDNVHDLKITVIFQDSSQESGKSLNLVVHLLSCKVISLIYSDFFSRSVPLDTVHGWEL